MGPETTVVLTRDFLYGDTKIVVFRKGDVVTGRISKQTGYLRTFRPRASFRRGLHAPREPHYIPPTHWKA